ncbi:C2H2-type zinc finger protein [Halohasta litorea]|uniref:C2H2-type zinc finger protein n=1 Tax=Halohasta litorea TaxID=869891 RepID=A0ABD6D411_9EURY|nr:C2H2-type zinc finger protein [Halohasta litorea]
MKTDEYECDLCGQSFDTKAELKKHAKAAHTKEL